MPFILSYNYVTVLAHPSVSWMGKVQ